MKKLIYYANDFLVPETMAKALMVEHDR